MNVKIESESKTVPEEGLVYAEVSLDNSPNSSLLQADLRSIENLIFRQNHVRENVQNLENGQYFSIRARNQNFKHTIDIKLLVTKPNLWENARSYIWRHFGQHEWTGKDLVEFVPKNDLH